MDARKRWGLFLSIVFIAMWAAALGEKLPTLPIGEEAYTHWEQWPMQRIGVRSVMGTTVREKEGGGGLFYTPLEGKGHTAFSAGGAAGVLSYLQGRQHPQTTWRIFVDGVERKNSDLQQWLGGGDNPPNSFPALWTAIPFARMLEWRCDEPWGGGWDYIYHRVATGNPLPSSFVPWSGAALPDFSRHSFDWAMSSKSWRRYRAEIAWDTQGPLSLWDYRGAPVLLRTLQLSAPREIATPFGEMWLRITWDDRQYPSVETPLALFFGVGMLHKEMDEIRAFPVRIYYKGARIFLESRFPMPCFRSARIELLNANPDWEGMLTYALQYEPLSTPSQYLSYFHASYVDHPSPSMGKDLVFLDTEQVERGETEEGDWTGAIIGTSCIVSHAGSWDALTGAPRFFIDDGETPLTCSDTWAWFGGKGPSYFSLPFVGRSAQRNAIAEEGICVGYRFLLGDALAFAKKARIAFGHGRNNTVSEHCESLVYWYGLPGASLTEIADLEIGVDESEEEYSYRTVDADAPTPIVSRAPWGPHTVRGVNRKRPWANPVDYADFVFEAQANTPYSIWLRGRALMRDEGMDSCWLQFDNDIGTVERSDSYASQEGMGNWFSATHDLQYSWASSQPDVPAQKVLFLKNGTHRLRIQPREGPLLLDQILLRTSSQSPATHPEVLPGDILLHSAHAISKVGGCTIQSDPESAIGQALVINYSPLEIYPVQKKYMRNIRGKSEFTLMLEPDNRGVLLRRTFADTLPHQCAQVYVADISRLNVDTPPQWEHVGVWYEPGGEAYSAMPHDSPVPRPTPDYLFKDSEFMIPARFTQGRFTLRIQIQPARLPTQKTQEAPWNEVRYRAYCWVIPSPVIEDASS